MILTLFHTDGAVCSAGDHDDQHKFLALKVLSAECYGTEHDIFEKEILTHLRNGDRGLLGYRHIAHLVDDFEHEGPNGKHVCLVFHVYGETLRSFGILFRESMIPTDIMRRFAIQLLLALDYAHHYGVIHTGNIPCFRTLLESIIPI